MTMGNEPRTTDWLMTMRTISAGTGTARRWTAAHWFCSRWKAKSRHQSLNMIRTTTRTIYVRFLFITPDQLVKSFWAIQALIFIYRHLNNPGINRYSFVYRKCESDSRFFLIYLKNLNLNMMKAKNYKL